MCQSVPLTITAATAGIFWKHCGSVQFEVEVALIHDNQSPSAR